MRLGFLLSDKGGSPLTCGLERGFGSLGHKVEAYRHGRQYDVLFVFNQVAHVQDYQYPQFPEYEQPIVFVDAAEFGYFTRLPSVVQNYSHAFAPGAMQHDTKNPVEQARLRDFLKGKSFPYFLREFSKYMMYPTGYHPIDYPLYHYSECPILPNREEYLSRTLDLFCSWGVSHPWRWDITRALREQVGSGVKAEILVLEENGTPRMPQAEYFARTRAAKTSVSFDGYGSSSFRLTEVLVRCLLLVGPLAIIRHAPLIDGVHCIEYAVDTDGETFISTDICAKLKDALSDPERSYRIHEAGYHHCMQHYTEKATAQYVLDTIEQHDWNSETSLTI